jgi:hypothetical protein
MFGSHIYKSFVYQKSFYVYNDLKKILFNDFKLIFLRTLEISVVNKALISQTNRGKIKFHVSI